MLVTSRSSTSLPTSGSARRGRLAAAVCAAPVLALVLAACSSSTDPAAAPPSSAATQDTGAGDGGAARSAERDAYDLKLAACIRGRGVDVADPAPGVGITESGPEVQAAASACGDELGPPPTIDFTPAEDQEIQTYYLALASCLRDRGYDVADPAPGTAIALEGISETDLAACQATSAQ